MSFTNDKVPLRFDEDGKFKIMQITDLHISKEMDANTLGLIGRALDREKPDLVVFTGDQIMGYGMTFKTGDRKRKARRVISAITKPVTDRRIPFTVTFGNHDPQCGASVAEQAEAYREKPGCIMPEGFAPGTFNLPLYSSDGTRAVFDLCIINSNARARKSQGGGFEPVSREQIEWFRMERDALAAQNGGAYLPTMVFQHIPVCEMYDLLEETGAETDDSVPAYRAHKGRHYILGRDARKSGAFLGEAPSTPDENAGEFEAVAEKGNVFAMFFGHDHCNSFTGVLNGVTLGYTQSASFREYGAGVNRGVRIIELDESRPGTFSTRTLSYVDIFGPRSPKKGKVRMLLIDMIPTSTDAAIPFVLKCIAGIAAVIATIVLLIMI